MRKITPLMIFAIVWLTLVLVSWFIIPAWQQMDGGLVILIGVAAVGAIAFLKDGISFLKDSWEYIKNAFAESESPQIREADDDSKITNIPWAAADQTLIRQYIELCSKNDKKYVEYKNEKKLLNHLISMGLAKKDKSGIFLTQAGVLLFCKQDYFPHAFLHCEVILRDEEKDVKQTVSGSVLESYARIRDQLNPMFATWNDPRVRDSFGSETQFSFYPEIAIIEALVNFYVHRDFEKDDIGYITLYPNWIEFLNPGLSRYSAEELLAVEKPLHPQYRRNPRLLQALQHTGLNQREGRGILRIKEVLEEYKVTKADGEVGLEIENDLEKNRFLLRIFKKQPSENVLAKYLQYVVDVNTYIDPRGIMQTRRSVALKLDEVFVSLPAELEGSSLENDNIEKEILQSLIDKPELDLKQFINVDRQSANNVDLATIIRENTRIVILGDPGSGKTTILRFLALQFARSFNGNSNSVDGKVIDKEDNEYGKNLIPILLRIANYADAFSRNRNLSLRSFILENIQDIPLPHDSLRSALEKTLDDGNAIVLLDGIDEILDARDRAEIGRRIEQFIVSCNPQNRFVITSRIVGFSSFHLSGKFAYFMLTGMGNVEIKKFLQNWCLAVERAQRPDMPRDEIEKRTSAEIYSILSAINHNSTLRALASNPLILTIIALIHRAGASLPVRRVELYELVTKTLVEDWELARGIPQEKTVTESEALRLLGPLAFWIQENQPSGLIIKSEVQELLAKTLEVTRNLPTLSEEVENAVEDFMNRVSGHTGVFMERGEGLYGFMHLAFQEYFAAREIVRGRNDTAQKIYQHRHDLRWKEPILLAIAYISTNYPQDAENLILSAILVEGDIAKQQGFKSSETKDAKWNDLLLAVYAISDCVGLRTDFINDVIGRFVEESDYVNTTNVGDFSEEVKSVLFLLGRSETGNVVANYLLPRLNDKNLDVRLKTIYILVNLGIRTSNVMNGIIFSLNDSHVGVRQQAVRALAKLGGESLDAVNALKVALNDGNPVVHNEAVDALNHLQVRTNSK